MMSAFEIVTVLITLSALFSYVNFQYIGMPAKIGVMVIALVVSIALLTSGLLGAPGARQQAAQILSGIDFNEALLHGMLAFLLFAGAQSLNLNELRNEKTPVVLLATVSVLVSTLVVGAGTYLVLRLAGIHVTILI